MRNEKKNSFIVNTGLFSHSLLTLRIYDTPDFIAQDKANVEKIWLQLRKGWELIEERFNKSKPNESDTEKFLVDKVLDALGFSVLSKTKLRTSTTTLFPDYVLFHSPEHVEESLRAEVDRKFTNALGVVEAKRFRLPLNEIEERKESGRSLPPLQLVNYLKEVGAQWGYLTNGAQWQIYNKNGSYAATRYCEFDLIDMLNHPLMPREFEAFVYLFSSSALTRDRNGESRLDRVYESSQRYAQEIGASFFKGCEKALKLVFASFCTSSKSKKNISTASKCHEAGLILLFRILSIRYLEDRGVLPTQSGQYREVSLDVLRVDVANKYRDGKIFSDTKTFLWQRLLRLFKDVDSGVFGIYPGHKGFETELFDVDFEKFFRKYPICDRDLAAALDSICRGESKSKSQIDFFDLGIEAIGDVYNHLLSIRPVQMDDRTVELARSDTRKKALGSYFTHPKLTQTVSDEVLEKLKSKYSSLSDALYEFKFCDNSCGSGHFLRRLVEDISYEMYISTENYEEKETDKLVSQNSFRRVLAQHSVYGIDVDKYAVWLTKVSLWLQTAEKGKPFVYLDHNIVCGDSIRSCVKPIKLNPEHSRSLASQIRKAKKLHSEDREAILECRSVWSRIKETLARYAKKEQSTLFSEGRAWGPSMNYHETFPDVYFGNSPGFSAIIGNPPWETVKPKIQTFYKERTGDSSSKTRKQLDAWVVTDASRQKDYEDWQSRVQEYADSIRKSGYAHQSGEVYTYTYFIERSIQTLQRDGLLCYVVKLGLYGDDGTTALREFLFTKNQVEKIWVFKSNKLPLSVQLPEAKMVAGRKPKKNPRKTSLLVSDPRAEVRDESEKIFPAVDPNEKFMLFTCIKRQPEQQDTASADACTPVRYSVLAKEVKSIAEINRQFDAHWQKYDVPTCLDEDFKLFTFSSKEARLVCESLRIVPSVKSSMLNVTSEMHTTNDRNFVTITPGEIPVYSGEEVRHYSMNDPVFWCNIAERFDTQKTVKLDRIAVNNILPNSRRKLRATIVPDGSITLNSALIVTGFRTKDEMILVTAALNSMLTEYFLRPMLSNLNLNNFRLEALPVPLHAPGWIIEELLAAARLLVGNVKFSEELEPYKKIEALLSLAYGLNTSDIEVYLSEFDGITAGYIQEVTDYYIAFSKLASRKGAA